MRRYLADFSKRGQIIPLGRACLPVDERGFGIASEQFLAFPHDGVLNGVGEAVDRSNRARAKRDADQENGEAAKPAPEIAERKAQLQRQAAAYRRAASSAVHRTTPAAWIHLYNYNSGLWP